MEFRIFVAEWRTPQEGPNAKGQPDRVDAIIGIERDVRQFMSQHEDSAESITWLQSTGGAGSYMITTLTAVIRY